MVTFNCNLSTKSFEKLTRDLKEYGNKLTESKIYIHEALADYAYERIVTYVPVDTGALMNSFAIEVSQDMGRVFTEQYYAKYVEFGTGIRGKNSSYPTDTAQMVLSNTWRGYSENINGQEAKKFMYQAVLDLEREYVNIARNVLKERGLL